MYVRMNGFRRNNTHPTASWLGARGLHRNLYKGVRSRPKIDSLHQHQSHSLISLLSLSYSPVFPDKRSFTSNSEFQLSFNSKPTVTMKFSITAAVLAFAATVVAMPGGSPSSSADNNGPGNANGAGNKGNSDVRFPVPGDMTVKQAEDKCGDQAQLSCCNKATYAGDSTNVDSGLLAGTLSNLIGTGSGSEGLGLFQECSKLPLQSKSFTTITSITKANDHSPHHWDRRPGHHQQAVPAEHCLLPVVSLYHRKYLRIPCTSSQTNWNRTTTSSALVSPALPSVPSSKLPFGALMLGLGYAAQRHRLWSDLGFSTWLSGPRNIMD